MSEKVEIASNSEWQLIKDVEGNVFAKNKRTNETKSIKELAELIRDIKSLIALVEGGGISLE